MAKAKGGRQLTPLPQDGTIGAIGAIGAMTVRNANGRWDGRMMFGSGGGRGHGNIVTAVAVVRIRRASHGGI